MAIQLRQICLVAEKLEPTIRQLSQIFGLETSFVDPGVGRFGLENTLLGVGNNFLEVVVPTREGTAGGRYLERRGGNGGYMVICQADTQDAQRAVRQRALARDVRVCLEHESEHGHLMQLHPGDLEAAFLEVDWDPAEDFDGNWEPAGGAQWRDRVNVSRTLDFAGVELQSPDPDALAERWAAILGHPVRNRSIALHNLPLRFVPVTDGRGPGLGGLDLRVADRSAILSAAKEAGVYLSDDRVDLCGTRFYLVD